MIICRALTAAVVLLGGCASQLDLQEGDTSIALFQVDAKAGYMGQSIETDGCILILRGDHADIEIEELVMETSTCKIGSD